jgi:hypothetical protein
MWMPILLHSDAITKCETPASRQEKRRGRLLRFVWGFSYKPEEPASHPFHRPKQPRRHYRIRQSYCRVRGIAMAAGKKVEPHVATTIRALLDNGALVPETAKMV